MPPLATMPDEAGHDRPRQVLAAGIWNAEPLGATLLAEADRLAGGRKALLAADDTALP